MNRPTIASVAADALAGDSFDRCLANFLDSFYSRPTLEAISEEPAILMGKTPLGDVKDAYLAATVEELSRKFHLPAPEWIFKKNRKLRDPWFASSLQGIRGILILESPTGFRSRNLFVSENALSRA